MELLFTNKKPYRLISKFYQALLVVAVLLVSLSKTYAQQPRQRIYANTVEKSADQILVLIRSGYVENELRSVNGDIQSYATLNSTVVGLNLGLVTVKLGGEAWVNLKFTGADKPAAGTPVTVKLGLGGNVLSVLSGLTVQATNGGTNVGSAQNIPPQLVNVLGGEQQIEFTITPSAAYDGIRVKLGVPENTLLSIGALASVKVYHAYFTKAANNMVCETPIDFLYGNTGIIAGSLNAVENAERAVDRNESTSALLRANVGVLNQTYLTAIFPSLSKTGDSIRLVLRNQNTGLLDLNLLSQNLKIRTYNGSNLAEDLALNTALLRLRLLGGSGNTQILTYPTSAIFNRIQISIGDGVAMALGGLYIHEIGRIAPKPVIQSPGLINGSITACLGAPVNLAIVPVESGSTYRWFDSNGTEVTTGLSNNGANFSPSGLGTGSHVYYVALYRNGCSDPASERSAVTIVVTEGATAADISADNTQVCIGQPATLNAPALASGATITNPVFKWYFDENRTLEITNGAINNGATHTINADGSLTITGLTGTRNYYISVSGTGTCENAPGSLKAVTATIINIPQPTIDLAGTQTIGTGGAITFTATATGAASYQWYQDGNLISGATGSTYTINNASSTNAGLYTVIAYGLSGCSSIASTAVNLQVGGFGSTKIVEGLNANGKIDAGSELTYKITITNTGSTTLSPVAIEDALPTGTSFVSADNGGINDNGIIKWDNLSVTSGSNLTVSLVVKVADDITAINTIENIATVTVPGQPAQNPKTQPIETEKVSDFTTAKTVNGLNGNNRIDASSVLTYTISVTNTGNTQLNNIAIADPIQAGTTYVANSADNGGTEDNGAIKWSVNLNVGETKTVSFQVQVSNDLTNFPAIGNIATVTDGNGNSKEAKVDPIPTEQIRSFTSTKTDNLAAATKLKPGDEVTYSINVTNNGNIALNNISIVDPIPAGTTYIDATASDNAVFSSNTLEWNVGVAVGTTKSVTFRVRVNDDLTGVASIKNRATITDSDNPSDPPKNPESPETDTDQITSYAVSKTLVAGLNGNGKIEPGAELTYAITVTNKGNVLLNNIAIEDIVPTGTVYITGSADNAGILDGNTLKWNIDIPVGTTPKAVSFKVKVNTDLTLIPSISNTATITDDTPPTDPAEPNPKQASTPNYDTEQNASFEVTSSIQSSDPSGNATPNSELTLTISVKNKGNVALNNAIIENPLPAYTTFVNGSGGVYDPLTDKIILNIPSIAVGATETVTFKVKADGNLSKVSTINNFAVITANSVSKTTSASIPVTCPNRASVATITVPGNNNTICVGSSGTATITVTSNDNLTDPVYYLFDSDNILVYSNTTGIFTVNVSAGISYTYSAGISANGYCETLAGDRKSITFSVSDLPSAPTVAATSLTVCPNTQATLSVSNPVPGITYNWYDAPVNGTYLGSNENFITGNISATTIFYVEAVNATQCASASRTAVTVNTYTSPVAPATVNITNGPLCAGSTAALSVDNPITGITYKWYTGSAGGSAVYEGNMINIVNITGNTTLYVEAVNQNNCVSSTRTQVDISVLPVPAPPAKIDITNGPICSGSAATLAVNNPDAGTTYRWYTVPNGGSHLHEGNTYTTNSLNSDLILYVEALNGNSCISATRTSVTVTVLARPTAPATVAVSNGPVCAGTTATLSVENPVPGVTYRWYTDATGGTSIHDGNTYTTGNLINNTTFFVEAVNANSCTSTNRTTVNVTVLPRPDAPISASVTNGPVCAGSAAILSVDNPANGITYRWYTSSAGGTSIGEGNIFTTGNLNDNTIFYVEAVNANSCTSAARTPVPVTVVPGLNIPVVSVQSKTTNSVTFSWNVVANATGYEISVNNGQTWSAPSSGNTGTTHTFPGLKPAEQVSISVRAIGTTACQTSGASAVLTAGSDNPLGNEVFIPNTFTPNNDGQNDYFLIYGNTISTMNMRVFNQWGQLIFQSNQPTVGWDGNYQGKAQPSAVYVYQVDINFNDGSKTSKKGTVTLIR